MSNHTRLSIASVGLGLALLSNAMPSWQPLISCAAFFVCGISVGLIMAARSERTA